MTNKINRLFAFASTLAGVLTLSACAPSINNEMVEVAPNETAFLIKLDGDTAKNQNKFSSEEFLEQNKIATRRVVIEHRVVDLCQNCTFRHNYVDMAAFKLIKINRAPVTREWTASGTTGTSTKNEAFHVESSESIDFTIGANITTHISEADAAKFLYHYGGKQLEDVIDQDVRGFVSSSLSKQFGAQTLDYGRNNKVQIFAQTFQEAKAYFAAFGITIDRLGFTDGMTYSDNQIQSAINKKFEADQQVEIAKKTLEIAQMQGAARDAVKAQQDYELRRYDQETERLKIQKWNGVGPQSVTTVGTGSSPTGLNVNVR